MNDASGAESRQWSDPDVEQVADGVHRVPLPLPTDGLRAINVYVLECDDGLTCIDGGWAIEASRVQLEASLATLGHSLRDITRFLVTHAHRDHYTQAATVRAELGVAVIELGVGERASMEMMAAGPQVDGSVSRLAAAGARELAGTWEALSAGREVDVAEWSPPDSWLEGEQLLDVGGRILRAVPTPGHTAGHYVFADEAAGVLYAGDHVLPSITPSVGFEAVYAADPLGDFLGSLETVRSRLPDLRLLPAHGAVGMSSHTRAAELLAHHDQRLAQCLSQVAVTGSTAYDVARELSWTRREHAFAALDPFNAGLAVMETLVHLDLLVRRGVLRRGDEDGTAVYRRPV